MLTIQYLEYSPHLSELDDRQVVEKLRHAHERLPFTHLLIGWCLPPRLLDRCRQEAQRLGIRFLRWHPVLTGDNTIQPCSEWSVIGAMGSEVRGSNGQPEFTFACPNNPAVQEAQNLRLEELIHQGFYQGHFLDRIRFPSPSADPLGDLGCFCPHCQRKAAAIGLDIAEIQAIIAERTRLENGCISLVQSLLGAGEDRADDVLYSSLLPFFEFRRRSVSDFVGMIASKLAASQMEIGLDCFSPVLANMVGQHLATLCENAHWIKLMTYAHTFAPAGLPFELSGLQGYLVSHTRLTPVQALQVISEAVGLPLPTTPEALAVEGLSSFALAREVQRGVELCHLPVLAGIELMDLDGQALTRQSTLKTDLQALRKIDLGGLALSWDLLQMPLEWLSLVRQVYIGG